MSDGGAGRVKTRVGNILTRVGAAVGIIGVVAMAIKLKITLTPEMQEILFYKGLFAAAAVLLILGAWYGREGRREMKERALEQKANELTAGTANQLDMTRLDLSSEPLRERERLGELP